MPKVVTGNVLRSGEVVYLRSDGTWDTDLGSASVANDDAALKILETLAQSAVIRSEVTAVYAMDIRISNGAPLPASVRERIRAAHATSAGET